MAILEILRLNDPVLRQKAVPVLKVSEKIKQLLKDMAETMYAAPGVGLAAPQVGISKRIVVIDIGEGLLELINPRIIRCSGSETGAEGCLSIPGIVGEVTRAEEVVVHAIDNKGRKKEISANGFLARAIQHELDHLDGILFIDKANNIREALPEGEEVEIKKGGK